MTKPKRSDIVAAPTTKQLMQNLLAWLYITADYVNLNNMKTDYATAVQNVVTLTGLTNAQVEAIFVIYMAGTVGTAGGASDLQVATTDHIFKTATTFQNSGGTTYTAGHCDLTAALNQLKKSLAGA